MKKTAEWLQRIKDEKGVCVDAELARMLHTSRQSISQHFAGKHSMNVGTAFRVARILNLHPMIVISCVLWEQTSNPEEKVFWESAYQRYTSPHDGDESDDK